MGKKTSQKISDKPESQLQIDIKKDLACLKEVIDSPRKTTSSLKNISINEPLIDTFDDGQETHEEQKILDDLRKT